MDFGRDASTKVAGAGVTDGISGNEEGEPPPQMVHKLQKAVVASRQKRLQQEEAAARESVTSSNEPPEVIEAREQRSQIAIIQMAPPAPGSSRTKTQNDTPKTLVETKEASTSTFLDSEVVKVNSKPAQSSSVNTNISRPAPSVPGGSKRKNGVSNKPKKRHHCAVQGCTYNTPHPKDLTRHMRKHTGEKPYRCDRCSKSFTRYDKLVQHIRIHEGHRPFACHLCSHTATDSSSLKKHLRTHDNSRPYKCQLCDYAAKDSSQLVVHLRRHTGDSPYSCTFEGCDAAFKTPSDLTRHSRLHMGLKPYKCSYCDYSAAVKCNLNSHMRRHTNPGQKKGKTKTVAPVVVDDTEQESTKKNDVEEDIPISLPFQYACKFCDFKADTMNVFAAHLKDAHQNPKKPNQEAESFRPRTSRKPRSFMDQKNYACSRCTAAFVCEDSLRCHMKQHFAVPNLPANIAPVPVVHQSSFAKYTPSQNEGKGNEQTRVIVDFNANPQSGKEAIQRHSTNLDEHSSTTAAGSGDYPPMSSEQEPSNNDAYTLHEMDRVAPSHGVIMENPAVVSYTVPVPVPVYYYQSHLAHEHMGRYDLTPDQLLRIKSMYEYEVPIPEASRASSSFTTYAHSSIENRPLHDAT